MHPTGSARAPLTREALQAAAGHQWSVRLLASAGSTNALAAAERVRNLVVIADHQQAGRGRLDREWVTPPGAALTFSAVVDPAVDGEWWPLVPLVAGIAVARALGDRAELKWPNDVLVDGHKVSGILVERLNSNPPLAVIGIGINVDQTREELPVDTATSLSLVGLPADRTTVFGDVLRELRETLRALTSQPRGIVDAYRPLCTTLGRDVLVDLPSGEPLSGHATDVDEHGRLLVATATGFVPVGAGDVVHVRPVE
jgi:BirA family biotin operon repressor/biotin-[acetyl-CoA-carboxylase] ligase